MNAGTVRRLRGGALAGVLAAGLLAVGPAASAETVTVVDEKGSRLQDRPNELVKGRMTYEPSRTVFVARVERLNRTKTRVFGSVYYPDGSSVKVRTQYRSGKLVTRGTFTRAGQEEGVPLPAVAQWDRAKNKVTLTVAGVDDPKRFNRRARLDVYTVTKGAQEGPHCPIIGGEVQPCNDDYVTAELSRR